MDGLQLFLLILQVVTAILLIILVLLQKSSGNSLGGIGGGNTTGTSIVSAKSSANFLTKSTSFLIMIFMVNCLFLAAMSDSQNKKVSSELERVIKEENKAKEKKNQKLKAPDIE